MNIFLGVNTLLKLMVCNNVENLNNSIIQRRERWRWWFFHSKFSHFKISSLLQFKKKWIVRRWTLLYPINSTKCWCLKWEKYREKAIEIHTCKIVKGAFIDIVIWYTPYLETVYLCGHCIDIDRPLQWQPIYRCQQPTFLSNSNTESQTFRSFF